MRIRDMAKMYPFPFLSYSAPMRGPEHSQVRPVAGMRIAFLSRTHALRFCALPGEEASKVEELAPATFSLRATHRRSADFPTMDERPSANATSFARLYRLCWS